MTRQEVGVLMGGARRTTVEVDNFELDSSSKKSYADSCFFVSRHTGHTSRWKLFKLSKPWRVLEEFLAGIQLSDRGRWRLCEWSFRRCRRYEEASKKRVILRVSLSWTEARAGRRGMEKWRVRYANHKVCTENATAEISCHAVTSISRAMYPPLPHPSLSLVQLGLRGDKMRA